MRERPETLEDPDPLISIGRRMIQIEYQGSLPPESPDRIRVVQPPAKTSVQRVPQTRNDLSSKTFERDTNDNTSARYITPRLHGFGPSRPTDRDSVRCVDGVTPTPFTQHARALPPRLDFAEPSIGCLARTRSADRDFGIGVRAEDSTS